MFKIIAFNLSTRHTFIHSLCVYFIEFFYVSIIKFDDVCKGMSSKCYVQG